MLASKNIGVEQILIQFGNLQKRIVELANGAAGDARKESKVLQDLVLAKSYISRPLHGQ